MTSNEKENNDASIPAPFWAHPHKGLKLFLRGLFYFLIISAVLVLVALIGIGVWIKQFYAPIDFNKADKTHLAGWFVLRDFSNESPETRSKLVEKYLDPLQGVDKIHLDSPKMKKFVPYAKEYVKTRNKKITDWEENKTKRSFVQNNYRIVPNDPNRAFIAISDIKPTQNLIDYLDKLKKSGKTAVLSAESKSESNVRLLTKEWFLRQMESYDNAPNDQKATVIKKTAEELNHISFLYNSALAEMGLPGQSDMEQLRDLHFMTDAWFDDTPPEELARLLWFKDLILSVFIAQRSGINENIEKIIRIPSSKPPKPSWNIPFTLKKSTDVPPSSKKTSPPQNDPPTHSDDSSEGDPTDFF